MTLPGRLRFHYAWVVAVVAFLALIVSAGVRSTPGVLLGPLQAETGWSRSSISLAVAINIALYGLMGPFAGAAIVRFGLRATAACGLAILAIGVGATAFVRTPLQLILCWGVVVGIGTGLVALVLAASVTTRWFSKQRGLVSGVLTASTATGQLIFLPILAAIAERDGWRHVTTTIAIAACVALIPVLLFLRDTPGSIGLSPYGADAAAELTPTPQQKTNPLALAFDVLRHSARSRNFWLLSGTFFICGASTNGLIGTHFIAACGDHGIPEVHAAVLLAMMGIFDLVGTSASGWLTDRMDSRVLLAIYYGLRGLSLLILPAAFANSFGGLSIFTVFYGLDWIATVPPTLRLTTDLFGSDEAPIVYGWIAAAHQLGAGSVALLAGIVRSTYATYDAAFLCSGALCAVAAFAAFGLSKPEPAR